MEVLSLLVMGIFRDPRPALEPKEPNKKARAMPVHGGVHYTLRALLSENYQADKKKPSQVGLLPPKSTGPLLLRSHLELGLLFAWFFRRHSMKSVAR
jgi:hypothetical protein